MNRFLIGLVLFSSFNLLAQQTLKLEYQTELPFQTIHDSDLFHLESSLLIRTITQEISAAVVKYKNQPQNLLFNVNLKSLSGARLIIEYGVNSEALSHYLEDTRTIKIFETDTYNWINRSFRTNIPYQE